MKLWAKILICIIVINGLGAAGAFLTMGSLRDWYEGLVRPPGVPPAVVFGPVWTVLYTLIGISLAIVWHRVPGGSTKQGALTSFVIQMVLNIAWTPVFFGLHWLGVALAVIATLWVWIFVTILRFKALDRTAAMLLVPYLIWVSYATYLNAGYFWLNRAG